MSKDAIEIDSSQSEAEASQDNNNSRKRKNTCGCKGNNSCEKCGDEEYVDEEEQPKGKGKGKERKTARMTTNTKRRKTAHDDGESMVDDFAAAAASAKERHAQLERELADKSQRVANLEAHLRRASTQAVEERNKARDAERKLDAERKEKEAALAEQKRLDAEMKAARAAAGVKAPLCTTCQQTPNPSLMVALRCGHSYCGSCFREGVYRCLVVTTPSILPSKIEITEMRFQCWCKQDSGVSATQGHELLSYPSRDFVAAAGFDYIVPKLACKCVVKDKSDHGIMAHNIFCPVLPFPCPFHGDPEEKRRCEASIVMPPLRGVPYERREQLSITLRAHFERDCKHPVYCPRTGKSVELHTMRSHLQQVREKLDIAAIMQYEMVEYMPADLVPDFTLSANDRDFRVGDYFSSFQHKSWKQIMEMLLAPGAGKGRPFLSPSQKRLYFPYRSEWYFSDKMLAEPDAKAWAHVQTQADLDDQVDETDDEADDAAQEVKMVVVNPPAQANAPPGPRAQPAPAVFAAGVPGGPADLPPMQGLQALPPAPAPMAVDLPVHLQMPAPPAPVQANGAPAAQGNNNNALAVAGLLAAHFNQFPPAAAGNMPEIDDDGVIHY